MASFFIWAHRGRNRIAPENTLAAFIASLDAGDRGIELDVTLSADGVPVVIHDDTVDRTTGGSGRVAAMTLDDLRSLDAGSWFDPMFAGERIPLLDEVMKLAAGRAWLNIEIKPPESGMFAVGRVESEVVQRIKRFGMADSVIVSSFQWKSLERVRKLDSRLMLGVLADRGMNPAEVVSVARNLGAHSLHPDQQDLLPEIGESYRNWPGPVYPYTVRCRSELDRLAAAGLHGCFADLPMSDG